tara:strand:- start:660 stop:1628 length:969 start_codon:yes stop_codon:yes gene_type:complete
LIQRFSTSVRVSLFALLLFSLSLPGSSQEDREEQSRKVLIQNLFEADNESNLNDAIKAAEAGGVAKQVTLEARFLFLVDQEDFAAVAALGPLLERQKKFFRIDDSVIFSVPEEFYSIIEYCFALEALGNGELAGFETHIKEAFWLSPRQATAFAPHIDKLRREQALVNMKVNLDQAFLRQADQKKVLLKTLMMGGDYLVIHFWSPWSTESEAFLPDFLAMVETLESHKIPVVSILIEPGQEALVEARKFCADLIPRKTGDWVVDNSKRSLARKLRVLELPTITILQRDGSVLFSGHPSEKLLWSTLKKVDPKLERPRLKPTP